MADPTSNGPGPETTADAPAGQNPSIVAGRYRIVRMLGRGGGGHVWLAVDENLGRQVALKQVTGETDTDVLLSRGFREARTSATLAHAHVVRVYDAFEHEGSPWIVMEYVEGRSLADLLEDEGSLPPREVAEIGAQMATALAAAHAAGILHRDVKPANVLLTGDTGRDAKLTDFGIARAEEDPQLTRTGFVSGTAAYFSPELARGEEPSAASDVWALGATLYAAVEGTRPFPERPNAVAQLHTVAAGVVRRPEQAGPLEPVLAGMLDPDPQTRWSAAQAAGELEKVARGEAGPTAAAAAAAAATAGAAAGRTSPDAATPSAPDPTERVPRVDDTRSLPHRAAAPAGTPAATPSLPAATPAAPAGTPPPPPRITGRRRSRAGWLGWLVAIPLVLLLGWVVWNVVSGWDDRGDTQDASSSETAPAAVGADEAETVVRDLYDRLLTGGLASAREVMTEDAWLHPEIADDLEAVEVQELKAEAQPDGTAVVTTVVRYGYSQVALMQDETLTVGRIDGETLITSRSAVERE